MQLEIPRLPFVSKEEEHASQVKIDLASVEGGIVVVLFA